MNIEFSQPEFGSVELPLLSTGGGNLFAVDVGKTELRIRRGDQLNPSFRDEYSGIQTYTINGQFVDSDAYQNAIDIADLFKSQWNDPIAVEWPLSDRYNTDIVTPAIGNEQPVTITYDPSRRDWVEVQLSLSRVDTIVSNSELVAETPTATGTGPVELQGVELRDALEVERNVGRPNDSEQPRTNANLPLYEYKRDRTHDSFSITFQDTRDAHNTVTTLMDLFGQPLGGTPLTLNFNGIFGLGSFNVVPQGSQAIRFVEVAAQKDVAEVPQINLRRVR